MSIEEFFEQFTYSPIIKTVHIDARIWDQIPQKIHERLKRKIEARKDMWDWIGTERADEREMDLARRFHKRLSVFCIGPYGGVEFKRRLT